MLKVQLSWINSGKEVLRKWKSPIMSGFTHLEEACYSLLRSLEVQLPLASWAKNLKEKPIPAARINLIVSQKSLKVRSILKLNSQQIRNLPLLNSRLNLINNCTHLTLDLGVIHRTGRSSINKKSNLAEVHSLRCKDLKRNLELEGTRKMQQLKCQWCPRLRESALLRPQL